MAFSPNGRYLASGTQNLPGMDGDVVLVDLAAGKERLSLSEPGTSLAFDGSGKILAVGGRDNSIKLWDAISGKNSVS